MIAHILYNKNSPGEGEMQHLSRELEKLHVEHDLIDADSKEGVVLAELYDLLARPAIVLVAADGGMVKSWQHNLPGPQAISDLIHPNA